jgi:hypothetical protein
MANHALRRVPTGQAQLTASGAGHRQFKGLKLSVNATDLFDKTYLSLSTSAPTICGPT